MDGVASACAPPAGAPKGSPGQAVGTSFSGATLGGVCTNEKQV